MDKLPVNDGWEDQEYDLGEDNALNRRVGYILNEACHVFHCHAGGTWKSRDKDRYASKLLDETRLPLQSCAATVLPLNRAQLAPCLKWSTLAAKHVNMFCFLFRRFHARVSFLGVASLAASSCHRDPEPYAGAICVQGECPGASGGGASLVMSSGGSTGTPPAPYDVDCSLTIEVCREGQLWLTHLSPDCAWPNEILGPCAVGNGGAGGLGGLGGLGGVSH